jgi:hypothetical protein
MKTAYLLLAAAALVTLSGCERTRRAIGLEKTVPDEFAVAAPAPLALPPDFNLRPPAPGSSRAQDLTPAEQARAALIGRARLQAYLSRGFSAGEAAFLGRAGADKAPNDIRSTLDHEVSSFASEDRTLTDKLVFWRDAKGEVDGTTLDPAAEKKRLGQNAAEGKKANEGTTPVISHGKSGLLGIF